MIRMMVAIRTFPFSASKQPLISRPSGVRIGTLSYRDRSIGTLSERAGRRLTAVLACRVVSFTLLDPEALAPIARTELREALHVVRRAQKRIGAWSPPS